MGKIPGTILIFIITITLGLSTGCGTHKQYVRRPLITEENDRQDIPSPEAREISLFQDGIENIFGREIDDYGNLSGHMRKLTNNHKQAKNTNAFDEVPNSSWFTNRHHLQPMSLEALKRGPNQGDGPDPDGALTITGAKVEGVSPGFRIKDSKGITYFVKFDIKGFPQLNTAAEVVSSKFVYACGYNVPENYLSTLDPEKLQIGEGVTISDKWGRKVPMTLKFVKQILNRVQANPDGTYRIVASRRLSGKPLGPFRYVGRRKDDPNDRVNHNHRRELRGYRAIAAWLNNFDTKANNTLDMFVNENGKHFVKHYILDFATSLGSGGYGKASPSRGIRGTLDLAHVFKKTVTLGLYVEPWEKKPGIITPAVGYFDSDLFDPGSYAFIVPNPAFQRITELDGFWGAKIVMSFTDEQIRAIVNTGNYANLEDGEYIARTLMERRDKTGRYWFSKINPLDKFIISQNADHSITVAFVDLAVTAGFAKDESSSYRHKLLQAEKELNDWQIVKASNQITLDSTTLAKATTDILTVQIETRHNYNNKWSKYVKVHFYNPGENTAAAELVAIQRRN